MGRLRLQPHFEFSDRMVVGLYIYLPVEVFICQYTEKESPPVPRVRESGRAGHNTHINQGLILDLLI
jgi:Na+/H+-translocating membrane pyrophosphatase